MIDILDTRMISNNAIHSRGIWIHNLSLSNGLLLNVMSSIFNDNTAGIHIWSTIIILIFVYQIVMVSNKALLGDGGCISSYKI